MLSSIMRQTCAGVLSFYCDTTVYCKSYTKLSQTCIGLHWLFYQYPNVLWRLLMMWVDFSDLVLILSIVGLISLLLVTIMSLFSSLLFSSGQTAVRLYGAEAANRAQCAAFDKPVGYWNLLVVFANLKRVIQCACFKSLGSRKGTPKCNLRISCGTAFTKKMKTCFLLFFAERIVGH